MKKKPTIAVVGATGLVGNEMVTVLDQLSFPFGEIKLLASEESAGEVYSVRGEEAVVETLSDDSFNGIDLALFATSAAISQRFVPLAANAGALAIDNSSHFRLKDDIPLVVPEVNWDVVSESSKIIANPNCSTIQLVPVLKVIHQLAGLKRVVISTYQSVSGAGKAALDELWEQTRAIFAQRELPQEAFQHQIAFNCIPQIDLFLEDGYTREEFKIINETRKILGLSGLRITVTAVRVPVLYGHAESVNVETEREITPKQLEEALQEAHGIEVYPDMSQFPMQITAASTDAIHVGRIRRDESVEHGLNLWIVADNVRKGAALNAVQIAERYLQSFAH